jgi:hypothetical protein
VVCAVGRADVYLHFVHSLAAHSRLSSSRTYCDSGNNRVTVSHESRQNHVASQVTKKREVAMIAATLKHWYRPHELHAQLSPLMLGQDAPHVLYANMKWGAPHVPDTSKLLKWLKGLLPGWTDSRTLCYLQKHQEQFRECLEWATNGCVVDFAGRFDKESREYMNFEKEWEQEPEVKFLREHVEHAGLTIKPHWGRDKTFPDYFLDMQLSQKKTRDPLDPILWDVIAHLSAYGRVFVRRCEYAGCRKFFFPKTKRKRFCSNSCRALDHIPVLPREVKAFRKRRREYMREWRQRSEVKMRAR